MSVTLCGSKLYRRQVLLGSSCEDALRVLTQCSVNAHGRTLKVPARWGVTQLLRFLGNVHEEPLLMTNFDGLPELPNGGKRRKLMCESRFTGINGELGVPH